MFQSKEAIGRLIELFNRRNVYLFHACQFKDFQSYLSLDGIPSREVLEKHLSDYTLFITDSNDKQNGVWDKVFVNLEDFGADFARGYKRVPNPYGPILFKIRSEALNDAEEVTITLRSAGAKDFDRKKEALTSIDEVDRIFLHSIHDRNCDLAQVKFKDRLYEAFPNRPYEHVKSTEVHCNFPSGLLPLQYTDQIIVDPYTIREKYLIHWVKEEQSALNKSFAVELSLRNVNGRKEINRTIYNGLAERIECALSNNTPLPSLANLTQDTNPVLSNWAQKLDINLAYQFERFVEYFCEGTLRPLLEKNLNPKR